MKELMNSPPSPSGPSWPSHPRQPSPHHNALSNRQTKQEMMHTHARQLDADEKGMLRLAIIDGPTSWPTAPSPSRRACRGTSRRNSCRRGRRARPGCCRWSPCGAGSGWAAPWRRPTLRSAACRSATRTGLRSLRRPVRRPRQRGSAGPLGRGPPGSLSGSGLEPRGFAGYQPSSALETFMLAGGAPLSLILWGRNPGKWATAVLEEAEEGGGGRRTCHGVLGS